MKNVSRKPSNGNLKNYHADGAEQALHFLFDDSYSGNTGRVEQCENQKSKRRQGGKNLRKGGAQPCGSRSHQNCQGADNGFLADEA